VSPGSQRATEETVGIIGRVICSIITLSGAGGI